LLGLAAQIEASLDFADEADVPPTLLDGIRDRANSVAAEMATMLAAPTVERLRDGVRVVLAGPPNSGKSTLLNALARREAAIVSPIAGTTRDRIEVAVAHAGIPFLLTDTAGLRETSDDPIERIGIARADEAIAGADLVLWLGDDAPPARPMLWLHARADLPGRAALPPGPSLAVSAQNDDTIEMLWREIADRTAMLIPKPGDLAINARQASHCREAADALTDTASGDELVVADALRRANMALARITGEAGIESMLDTLFGKFCIGK
jgi:tRNA modification GTPase